MGFNKYKKNKKGFTLIELLIIIGMVTILASAAIPIYGNLQPSTQITENAFLFMHLLRKARNFSLNGFNNSCYGVFIDDLEKKVILYKGDSYLERDASLDQITEIYPGINVSVDGFNGDMNFNKWTGFPKNTGTINMAHVSTLEDNVITINRLGVIDLD